MNFVLVFQYSQSYHRISHYEMLYHWRTRYIIFPKFPCTLRSLLRTPIHIKTGSDILFTQFLQGAKTNQRHFFFHYHFAFYVFSPYIHFHVAFGSSCQVSIKTSLRSLEVYSDGLRSVNVFVENGLKSTSWLSKSFRVHGFHFADLHDSSC